jgi:hypothetical protein
VTVTGEVLELLRRRPEPHDGIATIRRLNETAGQQARADAEAYAAVYEGQRAPMVFDVVASRQRRYTNRVVPLVARFSETPASASLEALAADGPGDGWGLKSTETETIRLVAAGLLRFAGDHDCDGDDVTVRLWADRTLPVVDAHDLDPYVGSVSGIGLALFAYMRVRSGGDGIKPDIRVRRGLTNAGFQVPRSDLAMLRLAEAVAAEADVPLLVLDQLLWQNT